MKTMMKWFVGISCAVAFIAIAFTPSSAAAQYACRPVSRIGAQSIEGPLTLTCSSCTDAIVLPSGKKLSFAAGELANLYRNGANSLATDGSFYIIGSGYVSNNLSVAGALSNNNSANGGSIAFNDPTRWLSTTTALLESSTTATAGVDTAFTLKPLNALDPTDKLFSVQTSGGSEWLYVTANGNSVVAGTVRSTGAEVSTGGISVHTTSALILKGSIADGATAIANKIGNSNALSTAGAKILSLYSDNLTTERAYFDYLGGLHFVTTKWEDLRVPMLSAKVPGTGGPDFGVFKGTTYAYAFDKDSDENLYFTAQLPHSYKAGTALKPHLHWVPSTVGTGSVQWGLECTKAAIDGTFGDSATIYVDDAGDGTAFKHQLASFADISGTGLDISSILVCHVFRNADNVADTYDADAYLLEVDFHYEMDSVGSTTATAK